MRGDPEETEEEASAVEVAALDDNEEPADADLDAESC